MTDNAKAYTESRLYAGVLEELEARHLRSRPYRPQTNAKDVHLCQAASRARPALK